MGGSNFESLEPICVHIGFQSSPRLPAKGYIDDALFSSHVGVKITALLVKRCFMCTFMHSPDLLPFAALHCEEEGLRHRDAWA